MKLSLHSIATFLLFSTVTFGQTTVSLGVKTGEASTNVLLSTSTTINRYSRGIAIYTASEIIAAGGAAGTINSLAWDKNGPGEYTTNDAYIRVLLKNVTQTFWDVSPNWDAEVANATEVFTSNTYSIPTGTGWKSVPFTTPFVWDGVSNIAVLVEWDRSSTPTGSILWGRSSQGVNANANRVGSTSLNALVFLLNDRRPLIQFVIDSTANIADVVTNVSVYPNPTTDVIYISSDQEMYNAAIIDLSGKTVFKSSLTGLQDQINISDLAAGLYLLRMTGEQGVDTLRVIKQ